MQMFVIKLAREKLLTSLSMHHHFIVSHYYHVIIIIIIIIIIIMSLLYTHNFAKTPCHFLNNEYFDSSCMRIWPKNR